MNYSLYHIFVEIRTKTTGWTTKVTSKSVENAILKTAQRLIKDKVAFTSLKVVGEPLAVDRTKPNKFGYSKEVKHQAKFVNARLTKELIK